MTAPVVTYDPELDNCAGGGPPDRTCQPVFTLTAEDGEDRG